MNKIVVFALTALTSTLMACSSAPTSNQVNYGVPFVNRTLPERMIDEGIEHTVLRNLPNVAGMEQVGDHQMRMAVDSFRREVLLTGEVPNQLISQNIQVMISSMNDVNKIYNYLNVGIPKTQANTLQDNFLKSKILAKLVTDRSVKASQYKLVVRDSTVYVMGYLTQDQQDRIMNAIRQTPGVAQVVLLSNLVTYIDTINPNAINGYNGYSTGYNNATYNYNANTNANTYNNAYNGGYNNGNIGTNVNTNVNTNPTYNTGYNNAGNYNGNYNTGYNNANTYNNTYNNANNGYANQPINNPYNNARPTSSYVQLYSGTDKP